MTNRLRWLALAGFFSALAAGSAACGEKEITTTHDLCWGVECEDTFACDPYDGQCKCNGAGGNICKPGEACNTNTGLCFSPKCEFQDKCERGEACDPIDGECKCGDTKCGEGEYCVDRECKTSDLCVGRTCSEGMACDDADGQCKCFGAICAEGESCLEGKCVYDPCAGKNCTTNAICSRDDGECHCMGSAGPICNRGEACISEVMSCVGSNKCDGVVCGGGTACDPFDGLCHCDGTAATQAVVCDEGQTCVDGECIGGDLCKDVVCPNDFQCSPFDGRCKCGNAVSGPECAPDDTCTNINNVWTCAQPCTLLGIPTGCPQGEACVYDVRLASHKPFCAPEGNKGDGMQCLTAYDCMPGFMCTSGNVCRQLCVETEDCLNVNPNYGCYGVPNIPAPLTGICFN